MRIAAPLRKISTATSWWILSFWHLQTNSFTTPASFSSSNRLILHVTTASRRWISCISAGNAEWNDVKRSTRNMISTTDGHSDQEVSTACLGRLDSYLKDCLQQVERLFSGGEGSTTGILVTEKERKVMVRTLLGNGYWTKAEFNAKLQDFVTRRQWERTEAFLSHYKEELQELSLKLQHNHNQNSYPPSSPPLSPLSPFQEGLGDYQRFQNSPPRKLFSFMSRGRDYQGVFERLLADADPNNKRDWLTMYQEIFQEPDERILLEDFVQDQLLLEAISLNDTCSGRNNKDLLLAAVMKDLPNATPTPPDGGKAKGFQSETNLATYLKDSVITDTNADLQLRILAPVFLQTQNKGLGASRRHPNPKCPYVIELPPEIDLTGKTTELDAIVVEIIPSSKAVVRIHQIWEAKATLHPVTIRDALLKKGQVLEYFDEDLHQPSLSDEKGSAPGGGAVLQIDGQIYSILTKTMSCFTPSVLETRPVKFGIFGKTLLPPFAAVRRMEYVMAEAMLTYSVTAVEEGLTTGRVRVPRNEIEDELNRLIEIADKYEATMVISSERN